MTNKKLNSYKGRLSPEQIAQGMNAAIQNAKRLWEDAALLLESGRFPSAVSLAILSIEESGKTSILRQLAVAKDDKELADCWRDYRSHTKKNVTWLLPQLVMEGARHLDDFRLLFDKTSDHPFLLDQMKQLGFYTDCLGSAHWSNPIHTVDELLARQLVQIAKLFIQKETVTKQEIELWIKHVGPVWMTDDTRMRQALVTWYQEMQQVGLAPEGDNSMAGFIYRGSSNKSG